MDEHSHHAASGLTEEESRNRDVLRHIMESSGFEAYCNEWWHYVLADEPYPNIYFNFCIAWLNKLKKESGERFFSPLSFTITLWVA